MDVHVMIQEWSTFITHLEVVMPKFILSTPVSYQKVQCKIIYIMDVIKAYVTAFANHVIIFMITLNGPMMTWLNVQL